MTVARTVGWNVAVQLGSRAAQLLLSGIATLVLVRSLGPYSYGQFAFILALVSIAGLISQAGLDRIVTRDMSRNAAEERTLLTQAVLVRFSLAILASLLAILATVVLRLDDTIRLGVYLALLMLFLDALSSVGLIFQVRLKMQYDALAMVGSKLAYVAVVGLAAWRQSPVLVYVLAPITGSAVMAVLVYVFARRLTPFTVTFDLPRVRTLVQDSLPSGVALLIAVLYLKLDGIMLGAFYGSTALGIYSAAYRPVEYFLLAGSVVVNPVFPLLSRAYGVNQRQFLSIYQHSFIALLAPVTALVALSVVFAPELLTLVFGSAYAASAGPYRVLICVLPLLYCNGWQALALLAANKQTRTMLVDLAGLVVNIAANLLLIPRFGPMGCAFAALATALVVSNAGNVVAQRTTGAALPGLLMLKLVLAGLAAGALMAGLRVLPWPIAAAIGVLAYLPLLFALRVVSLDQLRQFMPVGSLPATGKVSL